ncbi:MAG: radical SAM protein [bacterium]
MNKKNPGVISTMGRSFVRSLVKPTPLWAHFYVTRHCNFDCEYCGARDNLRKNPTLDEVKEIVLKLKDLGCRCVALMGGEPTIRADLVEIVEFCSKNNIYTQLSTNGAFLIDSRRTINGKTLLRQLLSVGLGTINISIDSIVAGFSDSKKELPQASETLKALITEKEKGGLSLMLNCVVTKNNIKQVPTMLEFCHRNKIIMATIFVQNPKSLEDYRQNSHLKKLLLEESDREEVIRTADYLIDKKQNGYRLLEPIAYYEAVKKWIQGDLDWVCDGGKYTLNIDTDGRVGICGYLPYLDLNIRDLKKDYYPQIKEYRERNLKWCTKKCIPSCMFCSTYYRQNPIQFLWSKIRYS